MSLATIFPKAWREQAWWLYLLFPLSLLYFLSIKTRRYAYHQGWFKSYRAPVPVMIIGNITVGGSGKTPLIIELVHFLQKACHLKVGVISRGYGGQGPFPSLVDQHSSAEKVGDEPVLIVQQTSVAMAVGPDRKAAIKLLLDRHDLDIILSDDGLQHLALQRDLEWIVLDIDRGLGNGFLLPSGFLREPESRLNTATVIEHGRHSQSTLNMHLRSGALVQVSSTTESSVKPPKAGDKVHAIAGIGVPERFFASLRELGFKVIEHPFPDHHHYLPHDIDFDDQLPIITTAKDAVKLYDIAAQMPEQAIWVLPVTAQLSTDCYALLHQQLCMLGLSLPPFNT